MAFYPTAEVPVRVDALGWVPFNEGKLASYKFERKYASKPEDAIGNAAIVRGGLLGIPRGLILRKGITPANDQRVLYEPHPMQMKAPPRNTDQEDAIDRSIDLLRGGHDHILEAPTGTGKTYMGTSVAATLGQPTLIVATKNDILEQWRDTIIKLAGCSPAEIGHAQANKCTYLGKRFILSMVQSVAKLDRYPADFYRYPGMVLFDECHHLGGEFFAQACQNFPAAYRLGLSATTKRGDGLWPLIEAHIGPVKVKLTTVPMSPKVLVCRTGWRIPRHSQWDEGACQYVEKAIPHSAGRMSNVIKAMQGSTVRNGIMARFGQACYSKGRNVVVMSDSIDHLKMLFQVIVNSGVPGNEIGYYIGGMNKIELHQGANKRFVLATYGMCSEGTDFPHWDVLIAATPRANMEQAVGRVIRSNEGKPTPIVLDLLDADQIFNTYFTSRLKTYHKLGAEIVPM